MQKTNNLSIYHDTCLFNQFITLHKPTFSLMLNFINEVTTTIDSSLMLGLEYLDMAKSLTKSLSTYETKIYSESLGIFDFVFEISSNLGKKIHELLEAISVFDNAKIDIINKKLKCQSATLCGVFEDGIRAELNNLND